MSGDNTDGTNVDVIWVGVFIGAFVWIFGLVAAILLSKGRVSGLKEKIWCIAGWHGPDMIRRMVNKEKEPKWEPGTVKSELAAFVRSEMVSVPFGFLLKYLIPGVLLLLVGLALSKDLKTPYNGYYMVWNLLGILIVVAVLACMLILFIFPRIWYDMKYSGGDSLKGWLAWAVIPKSVAESQSKKDLSPVL